jgi:hypothetical protein
MRTFIVRPKSTDASHHVTSDLLGLTVAEYDPPEVTATDTERKRALLPAANKILAAVRKHKLRDRVPAAAFVEDRGLNGHSGRHGWGQLFESFVDAALYTQDDSVAQREILDSAGNGTLVPGRYLYSSEPGARNWIQLCQDPMYRHHGETAKFWRSTAGRTVADLVRATLKRDDFDYVSLGPGNGQKDADLVTYWLRHGADIYYYPYDVSLPLVSRAVRTVGEKIPRSAAERFHVKAVLADFSHLNTMREVFAHRANPNVVALLGNSLGNIAQDLAFLHDLKAAMSVNDVLVIEVRLRGRDGHVPELATNQAMRFDFGALEHYLGIPFDREKMTVKVLPNEEDNEKQQSPSDIDDAITTVVGCSAFEFRGEAYRDVKLIYIHQYAEQKFLEALTQVGFKILESTVGGQRELFLVCVARPIP